MKPEKPVRLEVVKRSKGHKGVLWQSVWADKPALESWDDIEGLWWHELDAIAIISAAAARHAVVRRA